MIRSIVHLKIPHFYVQAECLQNPRLRQRPVVISPLSAERAVILAVSPQAASWGIRKGMLLAQATKICPDLKVLPPTPQLYQKLSERLLQRAHRITPITEPTRPGRLFLDLTGTQGLWGPPQDAAWKFHKELRSDWGLFGAFGIAGNKLVSRIASQVSPPLKQELVQVPEGEEAAFLSPWPVSLLPTIKQHHFEELIEELNLQRIRQVACIQTQRLRTVFGPSADRLRRESHGIDHTAVHLQDQMEALTQEHHFKNDTNDWERLTLQVCQLVRDAARQLRLKNRACQRVRLFLRYTDMQEAQNTQPMAYPSFWDTEIEPRALEALKRARKRRTRIRYMALSLEALKRIGDVGATAAVSSLDHCKDGMDLEKRQKITRALDKIRERFGEGVADYASTHRHPGRTSRHPARSEGIFAEQRSPRRSAPRDDGLSSVRNDGACSTP
ncbi:MAG: hypothetical protein JW937_08930 [Candidatus Omnitrophica bacterium]|nr:hypothetical protein [Candidatus Omnitrophota bacterium]